jgi:hypothetical protein
MNKDKAGANINLTVFHKATDGLLKTVKSALGMIK